MGPTWISQSRAMTEAFKNTLILTLPFSSSTSDLAILQFYFSSFDYPIYHLTQKTLGEFVCEEIRSTYVFNGSCYDVFSSCSWPRWFLGTGCRSLNIIICGDFLLYGEVVGNLSKELSGEGLISWGHVAINNLQLVQSSLYKDNDYNMSL